MEMETRQTSISHLRVCHPTAIEISSRLGLREPDLNARHGKPRACLVVICPLKRIRLTSPTWPIRRASRQVFPIGMVVVRSDKKRWSICRCSRSVASIHCVSSAIPLDRCNHSQLTTLPIPMFVCEFAWVISRSWPLRAVSLKTGRWQCRNHC